MTNIITKCESFHISVCDVEFRETDNDFVCEGQKGKEGLEKTSCERGDGKWIAFEEVDLDVKVHEEC